MLYFFNDTATTEIYTLSLHDALPISIETARRTVEDQVGAARDAVEMRRQQVKRAVHAGRAAAQEARDELERRIAETKAAYQAGADVARAGRPQPPAAATSDGRSEERRVGKECKSRWS